jgi:hypothetical protein
MGDTKTDKNDDISIDAIDKLISEINEKKSKIEEAKKILAQFNKWITSKISTIIDQFDTYKSEYDNREDNRDYNDVYKNSRENINLYKLFTDSFSEKIRMDFFTTLYYFFNDENIVTDEILFGWKMFTVYLMLRNKRYTETILENANFNIDEKTCSLRFVADKHMFKCFLNNDQVCYFKENSVDIYVS